MASIIQIRRDTASNWSSANPTLAQGELGIETDTLKVKAGNGSSNWTSLGYLIDTSSYVTATYSGNVAITGSLAGDNIKLDGNAISSTNTNGNIQLFPNGTGYTELYGNNNAGALRFNCESNSHGVTLKGPPHSAAATYSLELPNADGTSGQFIKTDGSGKLSFASALVATDIGSTVQAFDSNTALYDAVTSNFTGALQKSGSPVVTQAFTGDVAITGDLSVTATTSIAPVIEKVTVQTSTTGTINFDFLTQAVELYTANQTANRTINFRGDGSTTLNNSMAIGQSMTAAVLMTQGSTAYYLNTYQVDGSTPTIIKWSGDAPTEGNASGIDVYSFTIIKTANAAFTVLASVTGYE